MKEKESTLTKTETLKHYCFQCVAATFFNYLNRASCVLTKYNTKSVCSFSLLQTLSLIYHLFSFPTTHFPVIALKQTDEKESFCLLALVFDRLYKRLFLILCKAITLIIRVLFLFLAIRHNRGPIVSIRV